MSSKPPFHHLNGRRQYTQRTSPESPHLEVIKYIHDYFQRKASPYFISHMKEFHVAYSAVKNRIPKPAWKNVCREIEVTRSCGTDGKAPSVAYYSSNLPDEQLPRPDFKPFDLDSFLEQRSLTLQANKQSPQ